jgi:amidophosphoribosyltransferase
MTTPDQFIARNRTNEQIAKVLTADSVEYTTIDDLAKCIGLRKSKLCTGCLDGDYPFDVSELERNAATGCRPYEK